MDSEKQSEKSIPPTILKLVVGGLVLWNVMPTEAKDDLHRFGGQPGNGLVAYQRQQAELERQRRIRKALASRFIFSPPPVVRALPAPSPAALIGTLGPAAIHGLPVKPVFEPDSVWRTRVRQGGRLESAANCEQPTLPRPRPKNVAITDHGNTLPTLRN